MNKTLWAIMFLSTLCISQLLAQDESMQCVSSEAEVDSTSFGYVLPSIGTLNVLIVFAQFPDDNFEITNSLWPKGYAPSNIDDWMNETWTDAPIQGSLTHYFNDMSFNAFKFIGKTVSAVSPHSRQWYLDNSWDRWKIHKEILQQIDTTRSFAEFDQWNASKANVPDAKIDMIIFVWRNISADYPTQPSDSIQIVRNELDFGSDYGSLGWGDSFYVDNGARRIDAYDWGSGVTVRNLVPRGFPATFRTVIHEVAHYLLGHNDYHSGFGFWGMMASYGVRSIVANSFERSRLGWIDLPTITAGAYQTYSNIQIGDYVSTGDAYALAISPSNGEYFYIENHQVTSYWETSFRFGNIEPGLYLLRKDAITPTSYGDYPNSAYLRMIPADGRHRWTVNQLVQNPWGSGSLPVYKNLRPASQSGYNDLEFIPWSWGGISQVAGPIYFTEDSIGQPVQDVRFQGDETDAFRVGHNEIFSPWSNPNNQRVDRSATGFGFKINGLQGGVYSLDIYRGLNEYIINQNTILAQGEWNFSYDVVVDSGVSLTMQSNTILKFAPGKGLIVNGILLAIGTVEDPITFTNDFNNGVWDGITLSGGGASSSILRNVIVEHSTKGIAILNCSPTIQSSTINQFAEQGIYAICSDAQILGNTINGWNGSERVGTGIYIDNEGMSQSTLQLRSQNTVYGCVVGIDVTGPYQSIDSNSIGTAAISEETSNSYGINLYGAGSIENNKVYGDGQSSLGIGLWTGGGSSSATGNLIDHHGVGIADQGWEDGSVSGNSFTNNEVSYINSDGWKMVFDNDFWDSPNTIYNIVSVSTYICGYGNYANNYLQSWSVDADAKYYDYVCPDDPWYPPAGYPFQAGPTWNIFSGGNEQTYKKLDEDISTSEYSISCFPNPFNPETNVQIRIGKPSQVIAKIYDVIGREVAVLVDGYRNQGVYQMTWRPTGRSSGVYILRCQIGTEISVQKIVLAK